MHYSLLHNWLGMDVGDLPEGRRPRPGVADLGPLPVHPARLLADVLPLPAGAWGYWRTGELPHHEVAHVEE